MSAKTKASKSSESQSQPSAANSSDEFATGSINSVGKPITWEVSFRTPDGKQGKQTVVSHSRSRARMLIAASGNTVTSIAQVRRWWEIEFGAKVKPDVLLQMTRQMASFTRAGIPVLDALSLLAESSKSRNLREALEGMVQDIRDGDTLAKASAQYRKIFPEYYVAILEAAERSGDLAGTFDTLAVYLERDLLAGRAVRSAMYYPAVLMSLGLVAVVVLAVFVLPKFESFFKSLNTELPLPTVILLNLSRFVGQFWIVIAGLLVVSFLGFQLYRRTEAGRFNTDALLLRIPVIGGLVRLVALERFCRILGSLNNTGVPLTDSLTIAAEVLGNRAFARGVLATRDGVIAGQGLSAPMLAAKVFPAETVQMFRVGEQSGLLARQLGNAADYYSSEVDYRLKNLTSLIEPAVLLLVGGGTGFVAVALVSAMYGIYSATQLGG